MPGCVIEINGTEYYYPCDKKDSLEFIDNHLVNTSSSSITLYHTFPESGNTSSGYPRITCPANTLAYIRQSYSSSTTSTLVVNSYEFKSSQYSFSVYLLIVLIGVMICQLFKR